MINAILTAQLIRAPRPADVDERRLAFTSHEDYQWPDVDDPTPRSWAYGG
jgi:hypothetical protein